MLDFGYYFSSSDLLYIGIAIDVCELAVNGRRKEGERKIWEASNSSIDNFLQCIPSQSNSSHPISNAIYTPTNSSFINVLQNYIRLETIWKKMIQVQSDNILLMQWNPYGGRMSEIPEDATAFPHRAGNLFKIQYLTLWQNHSVEATNKNIQATRDLHTTFTPFVSNNPRETFLNYRDIDIGTNINGTLDFAMDFFKNNVKRLLQVKAKVDPTNFFRYEQSIPIS
ncbi:berberine bridge enzyme-like 17 [Spinacia oleracea]|uniref:Berberine bridge enzyme-like 17 n=1 Tax=Spinacia oleracea TaxID=3562 RepID=A0ABM3R324_SPIOL|nr:berberine bridge enzyme-like 17 [Spinacia oleracea]